MRLEAASFPHMRENSRTILMRQYEYMLNPPKALEFEKVEENWRRLKSLKQKKRKS